MKKKLAHENRTEIASNYSFISNKNKMKIKTSTAGCWKQSVIYSQNPDQHRKNTKWKKLVDEQKQFWSANYFYFILLSGALLNMLDERIQRLVSITIIIREFNQYL